MEILTKVLDIALKLGSSKNIVISNLPILILISPSQQEANGSHQKGEFLNQWHQWIKTYGLTLGFDTLRYISNEAGK